MRSRHDDFSRSSGSAVTSMKDLACSCWSSHFQSFRSWSPCSSGATATAARQPLRFLPTNPPFKPNSLLYLISLPLSLFLHPLFHHLPRARLCTALGKRMCTVVRFTQSLILLRTGVDLRRHSRFRRVSSFSHYNDLADRQHYSAKLC